MTLYQLECFVQVAELLSFVRAAEQMCISQPAITYQIRTLEKEMDVTLFERSTRHCRLTPAGQAFYHDAIQLISFYQRAVKMHGKFSAPTILICVWVFVNSLTMTA